jgi:hypothetical protein
MQGLNMTMIEKDSVEFPDIERILDIEIRESQDGLRMLDDAITDVIVLRIEDWLCTRQYIEEQPNMRESWLAGSWRSSILMKVLHGGEGEALKRDFQAHMQAGGKREAWTPQKALGMPHLKPSLALPLGIISRDAEHLRKLALAQRLAPSLAREFARRIVYGDLNGTRVTASG